MVRNLHKCYYKCRVCLSAQLRMHSIHPYNHVMSICTHTIYKTGHYMCIQTVNLAHFRFIFSWFAFVCFSNEYANPSKAANAKVKGTYATRLSVVPFKYHLNGLIHWWFCNIFKFQMFLTRMRWQTL
jgi:hypothetical protein